MNQKNVEDYFRNVRRLKEESQALVHLSGEDTPISL